MNPGHHAVKMPGKNMPWQYCCKCGLVYLKNEATRKAIKAPCKGDIE